MELPTDVQNSIDRSRSIDDLYKNNRTSAMVVQFIRIKYTGYNYEFKDATNYIDRLKNTRNTANYMFWGKESIDYNTLLDVNTNINRISRIIVICSRTITRHIVMVNLIQLLTGSHTDNLINGMRMYKCAMCEQFANVTNIANNNRYYTSVEDRRVYFNIFNSRRKSNNIWWVNMTCTGCNKKYDIKEINYVEGYGCECFIPANNIPANDIPANDIPANDIPANDIPANDIPANNIPTNDTFSTENELIDTSAAQRINEYKYSNQRKFTTNRNKTILYISSINLGIDIAIYTDPMLMINNIQNIHRDKYNFENYSYINSKFNIRCNIHGDEIIANYLQLIYVKNMCVRCMNESLCKSSITINSVDDLILYRLYHNSPVYKYNNIDHKRVSDKISMYCCISDKYGEIHGPFEHSFNDHVSRMRIGCPKCKYLIIGSHYSSPRDSILEQINNKYKGKILLESAEHSLKFNYVNIKQRVDILCSRHGIVENEGLEQVLNRNRGCSKCTDYSNTYSFKEQRWIYMITDNIPELQMIHGSSLGIEYKIRIPDSYSKYFRRKYTKVDGYSAMIGVVFEFNGCKWHGCKTCFPNRKDIYDKLYEKTILREEMISSMYQLINIWEHDYNNLDSDSKWIEYINNIREQIGIGGKITTIIRRSIEIMDSPSLEKKINKFNQTVNISGQYDYSQINYQQYLLDNNKSNKPGRFKIICKIHNESFLQTPKDHLKLITACNSCKSLQIKSNGCIKKGNLEWFITESRKKHGDKYDYSNVTYTNTYTSISITCIAHQITFKQRPMEHKSGSTGCPKCVNENTAITNLQKSVAEESIRVSNGILSDKSPILDLFNKFNELYGNMKYSIKTHPVVKNGIECINSKAIKDFSDYNSVTDLQPLLLICKNKIYIDEQGNRYRLIHYDNKIKLSDLYSGSYKCSVCITTDSIIERLKNSKYGKLFNTDNLLAYSQKQSTNLRCNSCLVNISTSIDKIISHINKDSNKIYFCNSCKYSIE